MILWTTSVESTSAQACEITDDTVTTVRSTAQAGGREGVDDPEARCRAGCKPDRGPSRVPLDERCGIVRFPPLERLTAFLGACLVPAEVEDTLSCWPSPRRAPPFNTC